MGWWPWSGKTREDTALTKQKQKLSRKCKAYVNGLAGCRKANVDDPSPCKNLAMKVVTCYGEAECKQQAEEHEKCYTSLYKTGVYKGQGHCIPYEEALKACLRKKGLYPV